MAVQVRSVKALCGLSSSGWAGRSRSGVLRLGVFGFGEAVKVGRGWVGCVQTGRGKAVKARFGMLWFGVTVVAGSVGMWLGEAS